MVDELKIPSDDDRTDQFERYSTKSNAKKTDQSPDPNGWRTAESNQNKVVRLSKSIVVNPEEGKYVDSKVIAFPYYNSFNYSLMSSVFEDVKLTFGVTSPNPGEGKTLVACNFAVSLALGYQKKTVLVDLSIRKPRLHEVFGTALSPGLLEALNGGVIQVSRTKIEHLCILTTGNPKAIASSAQPLAPPRYRPTYRSASEPLVRLEQMAAFRDVIYSLEQEFEFVIVDTPAVNSQGFPILFTNKLSGMIVVVDVRKTKRGEMEKMFRQLNERQVQGFVFNRVNDDSY